MKNSCQRTIYACYAGYVVQAVVNNFVPLLFVMFERSYQIPLSRITLLITVNFCIQLGVDLLSTWFLDRIGYRAAILLSHAFSAAGLVLLTILPDVFPDPAAGLTAAVAVYALGGGLLEVLISPIMESCPTDNKERYMSLLHSFYCWGHMAVVLLSTAFFAVFGIEKWKIMALLWALVPLANGIFFAGAPLYPIQSGETGALPLRELCRKKLFWVFMLMMLCAGAAEQAVSQWSSAFAEQGLGVSKTVGDLAGPDGLRRGHGHFPGTVRQVRREARPGAVYAGQRAFVHRGLRLHRLRALAGPESDRLRGHGLLGRHFLAGDVQSRGGLDPGRGNGHVRPAGAGRGPWLRGWADAGGPRLERLRRQSACGHPRRADLPGPDARLFAGNEENAINKRAGAPQRPSCAFMSVREYFLCGRFLAAFMSCSDAGASGCPRRQFMSLSAQLRVSSCEMPFMFFRLSGSFPFGISSASFLLVFPAQKQNMQPRPKNRRGQGSIAAAVHVREAAGPVRLRVRGVHILQGRGLLRLPLAAVHIA